MTPFSNFRHLRVTNRSRLNPCEAVQKRAVPQFYEPPKTIPWLPFVTALAILAAVVLAGYAIEGAIFIGREVVRHG